MSLLTACDADNSLLTLILIDNNVIQRQQQMI